MYKLIYKRLKKTLGPNVQITESARKIENWSKSARNLFLVGTATEISKSLQTLNECFQVLLL